jgi:hypothetical protein
MANLFNLLGDNELNGVGDKLRVLLDDILDTLLLEVLCLIFLEVEADFGTTTKRWVHGVKGNGEGTTGG